MYDLNGVLVQCKILGYTILRKLEKNLGIRTGYFLRVKVEEEKIILESLIPRRRNPVNNMPSLISKPINVDATRLIKGSWNED